MLRRATALLLCACGMTGPMLARAQDTNASAGMEQAGQLCAALRAQPRRQRTRAAYENAITAYRVVAESDVANEEAPEALDAAAGLLAEEGRLFGDERALLNAIGQYELLRQQYAGSRYRTGALLHEGEIYWHDLHDRSAAQTAFREFLRLYPTSQLAGAVRSDMKALRREGGADFSRYPTETASTSFAIKTPRHSTVLDAARASQQEAAPRNASAAEDGASGTRTPVTSIARRSVPEERPPAVSNLPREAQPAPPTQVASAATALPVSAAPMLHHTLPNGRLPLVTGVRHWSTPVYTRVAIDLQDQVQYEAARVPDPDRIYFDLHDVKISPELNGKSVAVTDGGFLKRIRIAQFSNDVTRVVLDVSQVSEYSAFFLPNPWRLIIDVHGSKPGSAASVETAATTSSTAGRATAVVTEASNTNPSGGEGRRVANPVTNGGAGATSDARSKSLQDIAALGDEPTRVKATHKPTTGPIAASVAGTTSAPQSSKPIALAPGSATASVAAHGGEKVTPPPATPATVLAKGGGLTLPANAATIPGAFGKGRHAGKSRASSPDATTDEGAEPNDPGPDTAASITTHEAAPTAAGQRSLVRALGLKIGRIVVDAGHGGHDSGTLGPEGIQEKEVVLDVSLRLGKLLKQRLGADVIYTRDNDTFIPLETRTAIANKAQADLFISVHANSSPDPTARGVETYYLNFTTSPDALDVAARENAVSDQSIHELSDLVKKITLKDKIDESREFASDVENSLYSGLESGNPGLRDRGVKKAPFVVLIGANMPSILAEISFLTNPNDASQLRDRAYRQRIAESLYRGVEHYIRGLSGVRLAQAGGRTEGE